MFKCRATVALEDGFGLKGEPPLYLYVCKDKEEQSGSWVALDFHFDHRYPEE